MRLEVSRPSGGFAFRLSLEVHLEGPCMRCLEPAALDLDVDAREVDQAGSEDEELHSPYVADDELDLGRWAHDAAMLALPSRFLCRPDCAGLCPVCGESLNDADPAEHEHGDLAVTTNGRCDAASAPANCALAEDLAASSTPSADQEYRDPLRRPTAARARRRALRRGRRGGRGRAARRRGTSAGSLPGC